MHAVPEKLAALRESFEATLQRQMSDYRLEFERKLRDQCKITEETAVRRAEDLLLPQQRSAEERLGGHIAAGHDKADHAIAKAGELHQNQANMRMEFQPLHARADAAAAHLDRLAVALATTNKECGDMGFELRGAISDLRAGLAEEVNNRKEMGGVLRDLIKETADAAAKDTREASMRADDQAAQVTALAKDIEARLLKKLEETAAQSLRESKLGDQDVTRALRPEIQAAADLARSQAAESQERAELLVKKTVTQLREELTATHTRLTQSYERHVQMKVGEVMQHVDVGLEGAHRKTDLHKNASDAKIDESNSQLRKVLSDLRSGIGSELDTLRQNLASAEGRATEGASEAEQRAIAAAGKRLDDAFAELSKRLNAAREALTESDEKLRQTTTQQLEDAVNRLTKNMKETAADCNNHADSSVGHACTTLRSELAEAVRNATERTDKARADAASALNSEVNSRQAALAAAQQAREDLGAALRQELKRAMQDAAQHAQMLSAGVDKRLDTANGVIESIERSLEAFQKHHSDTTDSIKNQLRIERQRTEEADTEASRLMVKNHDSLEAHLSSEAADIRASLAETRRKLHEEADQLRHELRQQPTRRDVAECASTASDRCNELNSALDGHRTRLESAVADFSSRTRDVSNEVNEARLRMQRETMALGHELTQLRAASTSLTNGVMKALAVMGLLDSLEAYHGTGTSTQHATALGLAHGAGGPAGGGPPGDGGRQQRGVEVEELLEWEKQGKSLASRVAKHWHSREVAGFPTFLTIVDSKANALEMAALHATVGSVGSLGNTTEFLRASMNASTCASPPESRPCTSGKLQDPYLPSTPAGPMPEAVAKARQQRVVHPGSRELS